MFPRGMRFQNTNIHPRGMCTSVYGNNMFSVLAARERDLFAASARKIYECLSHTATVNGLVRAMEFGVCLPRYGRDSSRNELVGRACLTNRSICCLHENFVFRLMKQVQEHAKEKSRGFRL